MAATFTLNRKPFLSLLLLVLLLLGGCGAAAPPPIVVFCSPDSPRMRQALEGFKAGIGSEIVEVIMVPQFGPEGAQAWSRLNRRPYRLLVSLGTPALLRLARAQRRAPLVFGLVANPYFTGAAYDPRHPEIHQESLTGIASAPPLAAALQQGVSLTGSGPWGLLYDPTDGTAADLAREFAAAAPRFGIKPLLEESTGQAHDRAGLERLLAQGARVIYLPPAASAARYAPAVLALGAARKVMVVSGYPEGSHRGALLWVSLDYRALGAEVAALARRVLLGANPARLPIVTSTPLRVAADETLIRHWSGYPPKNRATQP
jgi:putative tryptophan/tyrosine transport system substrate-binding protein